MSDYNSKAFLYDLIVGNTFYNRLMWGNWKSNYLRFAELNFIDKEGQKLLDLGCGTLTSTAPFYSKVDESHCFLADPSEAMIGRAQKRVEKSNITYISDQNRGHVYFENLIHDLNNQMDWVVSYGVLHVVENKTEFLSLFFDALKVKGCFKISCFVSHKNRRVGVFNRLVKMKEIYLPIDLDSYRTLLDSFHIKYEYHITGNMLFIQGEKIK